MGTDNEMRFKGRTAVITGAASGMGLLESIKLAAEGANVVMLDVNKEAVERAAEDIRNNGGESIAIVTDIRDYKQVEAAVKTAMDKYNRIDILINSAGGAPSRVFNRHEGFKDLDISIIDWGIDVNLRGAIYLCHAVIGHMMEQKRGVIVNMGSVAGERGSSSMEYSATKSAMNGLTKALAIYGAPYGIRAVCVSPGPVLTRPAMAKLKTLIGRAAEPEEVVNFILYLISDKAAFITGTNHIIDGGRVCLFGSN